MIVSVINIITGKRNEMDLPVTIEQIGRWQGGELVQVVFPTLKPEEREFLITGLLPNEQDKLFNNFEE